MKRVYTKPELFCEEYELSVAIAGDCGDDWDRGMFTQSNINSCAYKMGNSLIFSNSLTSTCIQKELIDEDGGFYCYNTVEGMQKVFAS